LLIAVSACAATACFATSVSLAFAQQAAEGGRGRGNRPRVALDGPVPRYPDGTVDLGGAWTGGGPVQDMEAQGKFKPGEIPLLPWAKTLMESRTPEDDPHAYCMPMGVPRQAGNYPWRFVQYPTHTKATHIFVLWEGNIHSFRQIFMDGKHPADPDPTWFGHSIGSWDRDTLMIDTVGFNDKFWFDRRGHPHTEQLHTIERWTRLSLGELENKFTLDDPGAYSKPIDFRFVATLMPPQDELLEYICQENNQYGAQTIPGYKGPQMGKEPLK
jgi:hypothetical protein